MENKNKLILIVGIVVILVLASVGGYFLFKKDLAKESFTINTALIKMNIVTGSNLTSNFRITNQEAQKQDFKMYFSGLDGIASLDSERFFLDGYIAKEIKINFKDVNDRVEIYTGYLVIESNLMTKKIPVILTVEDINPFFTILPKPLPAYEKISPGGKLGVEVRFFDLKSKDSHSIDVNYVIKNFDNEILVSYSGNLIIKETAVETKVLDLPTTLDYGNYVFIISVDYNGKSASSYFFEITKGDRSFNLGTIEYFALIVLVFIVGMFWLIFRFFGERDKLILQLHQQQGLELKNNLKIIGAYRQELSQIRNLSERKIKLRRFDEQKEKIISKIKKKHKIQKEEITVLRKKKKVGEMARKLKMWERQGYKMSEFGKTVKSFSKDKMKNQLGKWKREGYNVDVFKNK